MQLFTTLSLTVTLIMLGSRTTSVQTEKTQPISWSAVTHLPLIGGMQKQPGVAGPFTGVSNGVLLIAGGANFAEGAMPWQGGKKLHQDIIYILEKTGKGYKWIKSQSGRLKQKTAYGASATVAGGVVCAGGETDNANSCKDVFLLNWDASKQEIVFKHLPSLPYPVANAAMAGIGNIVYLAGGESGGKPTSRSIALDLGNKNAKWELLPPMPVAMSHSVAVIQSNGQYPCVYVIGGRSSTGSGISTLHNNTFCYDPKQTKWLSLAPVGDGQHTTNLSAASAAAYGKNGILLIGGDKGTVFHRLEVLNAAMSITRDDDEKQRLQNIKMSLLNHHPGFSRDVYLYNTKTNAWKKTGELPFSGQVTTNAVLWDNDIFIPCGEIKPGIRTPAIIMGKLERQP